VGRDQNEWVTAVERYCTARRRGVFTIVVGGLYLAVAGCLFLFKIGPAGSGNAGALAGLMEIVVMVFAALITSLGAGYVHAGRKQRATGQFKRIRLMALLSAGAALGIVFGNDVPENMANWTGLPEALFYLLAAILLAHSIVTFVCRHKTEEPHSPTASQETHPGTGDENKPKDLWRYPGFRWCVYQTPLLVFGLSLKAGIFTTKFGKWGVPYMFLESKLDDWAIFIWILIFTLPAVWVWRKPLWTAIGFWNKKAEG